MTVVARMVATLEAETSQFHARMTAAETQLGKWSSATVSGRRATIALNNGLQMLAFQAAGIPGPIGKAASAIGSLGIGGGPVLLATAALGAFALAWKVADDAATLHANNVVAAAERMRKNITAAAQETSEANRQAFQRSLDAARAQLDSLRSSPLGPQRFQLIGGGRRGEAKMMPVGSPAEDRQAAMDPFITTIRQLEVALAGLTDRVNRSDEAFELRQRALEGPINSIERRRPKFEGLFAKGYIPEKIAPREFFLQDVTDELASKKGRPEHFKMTPEFAIMSSMAMMQGAQMGGIGGFLGAAAGPAAAINPLAGAIVGGLGGIFSRFDKSEERRHRELVDKLERLANEVGLERVTVVFTGPDGHQVRKSLADLESSDAVSRVPGPVGATG